VNLDGLSILKNLLIRLSVDHDQKDGFSFPNYLQDKTPPTST
jgi:hypothetical protein